MARWLVPAGLLLAAYAALGYLAVDPLARWAIPALARSQLGSQAQVQRVAFDPWRLKLTAEGLQLSRADGEALAGVARLAVDFEAGSLWQWAWHFQSVTIEGAQVHLEIAPDGRLNWADLLATVAGNASADAPPATTLPRVRIDRLRIADSTVAYVERNRPSPWRATLQPLSLSLDDLSTLPSETGRHALQAQLPEQGGRLRWSGEIGLNPLASRGRIELEGLQLARLAEAVREPQRPVDRVEGLAAGSWQYQFALVRGGGATYPLLQVDDLALTLDRPAADLRTHGQAPARVMAQQLQLRAPQLQVAWQDPPQVQARGVSLALRGLGLAQAQREMLALSQAQVDGVSFDARARRLQVRDVLLEGGVVNSRRSADGRIDWASLAEALSATASTASTAAAAAGSSQSPLRVSVEKVRLARWKARHDDQAFLRPLGVAIDDLALAFALDDPGTGLNVTDLQADLTGIALTSAASPQALATLSRLGLKAGRLDTVRRTARVDALALSGLRTQVVRPAGDGPLNWVAALQARAATTATARSQAATSPGTWRATMGRLSLDNATVRLEDRTPATPVVMELRGASADLRELSLDLGKPVPVQLRLPIAQGGRIEASGRVSPQPLQADLQLRLDRVALRPLAPYLAQVAYLRLDGGQADLRGRLALQPGPAGQGPRGHFTGSAGVRQLAVSEEADGAAFLAWQEVSSESVRLDLAPPRLRVGTLRVVRPVGKFIIHEDGSLNAARMLRPQPAPGPAPVTAAAPASAPPAPGSGEPAVAIERVSVDNASLEFADLTLRPQFGTYIDSLSGVINGLSSDPSTTAQVELDGKVETFGSARVRGTVQPFQATESTDLKLALRNLEMTHLTPYSGKFAGRRIDSGRLSVDLEYKIQRRQLSGQNKFIIQQLKLGERVDSPDAVNLPLDLAIALLQDSDGVIDLDLPVSGSLDDPQFSYGRIIWKAITNVLTRIVTAPFRALGSLLGAHAEKMQDIDFDPGSAALAPQEQEKLDAVAQALAKRPALRLAIAPAYDSDRDTTALQEQAMRRAVLAEAGVKLEPGERPGPLDLFNTKVQSAIERQLAARTRSGPSLRFKLLDDVKDAVRSAKAQDVPRYQQLLQQLRPTFPVTPAQLEALAIARANAMREHLMQSGRVPAQSVALDAPAPHSGQGESVSLRLALQVAR